MATNWLTFTAHVHLTDGRRSLVEHVDGIVATCPRASAIGLTDAGASR